MTDLALTQSPNWASYSHQELYDAVHSDNNPMEAGAIAGAWTSLSGEITDHAQRMSDAINATTTSWQGPAGDAARNALGVLGNWSGQAAQTAGALGQQVVDQAQIMANARAAMPAPVVFDWNAELEQGFASKGITGLAAAAADARAKNEQAIAAHQQAVTVMTTMENQSRQLDNTTPQFSVPPNPIQAPTPANALMQARQVIEGVRAGDRQSPLVPSVPGLPAGVPVPQVASPGGGAWGAPGGPGSSGGVPSPARYVPAAAGGSGSGGSFSGVPASSGGPGGESSNLDSYAPSSGSLPPDAWSSSGSAGSGDTTAQSFSVPTMPDGSPASPGQNSFALPSIPGQSGSGAGFGPSTGGPNSGSFTPPPLMDPEMAAGVTGLGGIGGGGGVGGVGGAGIGGAGIGGGGGIGGAGTGGVGAAGVRGGIGSSGEPLSRGASTGSAAPAGGVEEEAVGARGTTGAAGQTGASTGSGAGGGSRGKGEEDKEHKSAAYLEGEDIFRVPYDDLPPPVIGLVRKKENKS